MIRKSVFLMLLVTFPVGTSAADITFYGDDDVPSELRIKGTIVQGDYQKLASVMSNLDLVVLSDFALENFAIRLDSPGGNALEALQMADLLRRFHPKFCEAATCTSGCFFIYATCSYKKVEYPEGKVGVHRPYFPPEVLANAKVDYAEKSNAEMVSLVKSFLEELQVPTPVLEKMMATPSTSLHVLKPDPWQIVAANGTELRGFSDLLPDPHLAFDDWLHAQCVEDRQSFDRLESFYGLCVDLGEFKRPTQEECNSALKQLQPIWSCLARTRAMEFRRQVLKLNNELTGFNKR